MIEIRKVVRAIAAVSLAFGSLFWTTTAHAEQTIEEAQAALDAGYQELEAARLAVQEASATVSADAIRLQDAISARDASLESGTITETFSGGVIQTSVQVLLNESTPIANAGNPYLATGNIGANLQDGYIYINQYPADFKIVAPSPATQVSFWTYARNGNQTVTVNFSDGTTGSFINYNGVGNSACPSYECLITYTAPDGKSFDSIYFPSDFDIFMIDNVTFTTNVYDPDLQQAVNLAQADYNNSLAILDAAEVRFAEAQAAIPALEQAVQDAMPPLPPISANVICQSADGESQDSFLIYWDNTVDFFSEVGYIPAFFCEGGFSSFGDGATYVSDDLEDVSLGYYNGVIVNPEPTPEPSPEPTSSPTVSPEPIPTVEPSPEETVQPTPEQTPSPEPSPVDPPPVVEPPVEPNPEPTTQEPAPIPEPEPQPEPQPEPEPVVPEQEAPLEEPEPEASNTPSPEPTPSPSKPSEPVVQETKSPTPAPSPEPTVTPTPEPTKTPEPEPQPTIEPTPSEPETIIPDTPEEAVTAVLTIDIDSITAEEAQELKSLVYETFDTAEPGSEEYEQALEALAVLAEADDPELPQELAAIPLLGDVAGAVLTVFNDLGNVGADISPEVRERAEEVAVAAVIVGQIAQISAVASIGRVGK